MAAQASTSSHTGGLGTETASRSKVDSTSGGTSDTGSGFWPFTDEDEAKNDVHTGKEGRGWLRTAIVVGVLLVLVVAMAIAFNRGREDGDTPNGSSENPSQSAAAGGTTLDIAGARDFDPEGDPPEENPDTVKNAIDGDPATSWQTLTYRGNPALGGLKPGVGADARPRQGPEGLVADGAVQGRAHQLRGVRRPRGCDRAPRSPWTSSTRSAAQNAAPERATVKLDPTPTTRYLLVWLTKLPAADGGYRGEITDITVRS